MPVIVDPSHSGEMRELVKPMSLASITCGADSLIIEAHLIPENSLSDSKQTINISELQQILNSIKEYKMSIREKRDLYDQNSNLTGKTYFKGDPIPEGYYPMVVMIAIQNSEGKFLMQKRVPRKGGDWGVTGGHPKSGETTDQGIITEVMEELGVDISNQKLETFCSGCDGKDCYKMYYTKLDLDIEQLHIQEDELTEVKWFSMDELQEMVNTKELNQDQVDFFVKCTNYLNNKK